VTQGGSVALWDARDDRLLHQFGVACRAPGAASLSPGDSKVAVVCGDGRVLVLDAATGQQLTDLPAITGSAVEGASFSPDGRSIITAVSVGNRLGGVKIWSTELANPSLPEVKRLAEHLVNP
jgi:WD40 repeat protein